MCVRLQNRLCWKRRGILCHKIILHYMTWHTWSKWEERLSRWRLIGMKSKQTNFSETILYHSHLLFLRRITDYGFWDYIVDVLQCHIFFYKQSHASFKVVFVLYGMNVVNMNSAKLAITSLIERGVCNIIFLMQCFAPFKNQVNEKKNTFLM